MNLANKPETSKKPRSTSLPLIGGVLFFGLMAYYLDLGPRLMTQVMYFQEQLKVKAQANLAAKEKLEGPKQEEPETPAQAGGGGADREQRFKTMDKDENGKLERDEINERLQARLAFIDKDSDGIVSKEEYLSAPAPAGGSQGPGGPFQDPPGYDNSKEPQPESDTPK